MYLYECSRCNISVISEENDEWVFCKSCGGVAGPVNTSTLDPSGQKKFFNKNDLPVKEPLGLKDKECADFNNPITYTNTKVFGKGFR